MNSTHRVEVVEVALKPHPNADTLSIANVFGYPVVVRTEDWSPGSLGAYLTPDSVVDVARPEFTFLPGGAGGKHRIRAKKLRGVISFGLLIPAPPDAKPGDDVAERFGVEHYEPELKGAYTGGEAESAPNHLAHLSRYDVDALRRYREVFVPGEEVVVTEKIHGANSRYCFLDGRMWCGSRSEWKRQDDANLWWKALATTPTLEAHCRAFPGRVVYGEVYGDVQSFRYGRRKGEARFAAFDVLLDGRFLDAEEGRASLAREDVPVVPLLGIVPFDFDRICAMADGPSQVLGADHPREGCVIKPLAERFHQSIGRVQLKVVGADYLTMAEPPAPKEPAWQTAMRTLLSGHDALYRLCYPLADPTDDQASSAARKLVGA
jgi:RNA ligase (TIGR02306 family)